MFYFLSTFVTKLQGPREAKDCVCLYSYFSPRSKLSHGCPQLFLKQRNMLCYFICHYVVNWVHPSFQVNVSCANKPLLTMTFTHPLSPLGVHVSDAVLGSGFTSQRRHGSCLQEVTNLKGEQAGKRLRTTLPTCYDRGILQVPGTD